MKTFYLVLRLYITWVKKFQSLADRGVLVRLSAGRFSKDKTLVYSLNLCLVFPVQLLANFPYPKKTFIILIFFKQNISKQKFSFNYLQSQINYAQY